MKARIALAGLLGLGCWSGAQAAPQTSLDASVVNADKFERIADHVFRLTGNVDLTIGVVNVRANAVELRTTGVSDDDIVDFVAEGNVVLTRGPDRLACDRLQFNPQNGTGTFQLQQAKK